MLKVKYHRHNITLPKNTTAFQVDNIKVPDGEVTHISLVHDNTTAKIVEMGIYENNSEVVKPCDIRFTEKTSSGSFLESLRPVSDFQGGREVSIRLTTLDNLINDDITVQVLLVIQTAV